jgi:hypothetical protein
MDQFERIKGDIEDSRADLQGNLRELERRVEDVSDWRYQFGKRPYVMLGAAAAAGAVVGILAGPRRWSSSSYRHQIAGGESRRGVMDTVVPQAWENIKTALIGMAASRLQDVMEEVLPGFKQHYHNAEQRTTGFVRAT